MNTNAAEGLVQRLLSLPVFRSEWVLWLLLALSLLSVAVMVERWFFYRRRKIDFEAVSLPRFRGHLRYDGGYPWNEEKDDNSHQSTRPRLCASSMTATRA